MKISKINGIQNTAFLGQKSQKDASFKVLPLIDKGSGLVGVVELDKYLDKQQKKSKFRENLPEMGVVATSIAVGAVVLYKLLLGKKY